MINANLKIAVLLEHKVLVYYLSKSLLLFADFSTGGSFALSLHPTYSGPWWIIPKKPHWLVVTACFPQLSLPQVLKTQDITVKRCFFPVCWFSSHIFCSNESYSYYWKIYNNINLWKCLTGLEMGYSCWWFSWTEEWIAVFAKSWCKTSRLCSGSCVYVDPWRCTGADLYWLVSQALRRRHRFLNRSSPPPYEILSIERSRRIHDLWWSVLSRCSPSGLSCCHLTHDLLLATPGGMVWPFAQFPL